MKALAGSRAFRARVRTSTLVVTTVYYFAKADVQDLMVPA